jgi:hypothetical protein
MEVMGVKGGILLLSVAEGVKQSSPCALTVPGTADNPFPSMPCSAGQWK